MPNDQIEEHIGATQPDASQQAAGMSGELGKHIIAEPEDGKEKEANVLSHHAGASSDAPASSGIPSAMKQHGLLPGTTDQDVTPMPDHAEPTKQDTRP